MDNISSLQFKSLYVSMLLNNNSKKWLLWISFKKSQKIALLISKIQSIAQDAVSAFFQWILEVTPSPYLKKSYSSIVRVIFLLIYVNLHKNFPVF